MNGGGGDVPDSQDVPDAPTSPGAPGVSEQEMRRRADFRAFVRANHPDVGGDPEVFAAGLAQYRAGGPATGYDRHDAGHGTRFDPRFDAPVTFVDDGHRMRKVADTMRRWQRRRRRDIRLD